MDTPTGNALKETCSFSYSIGGLSVLVVVGYILSRSTLKPIRNIVKEAEKITASHIDKRLPVKNEQDELGELSTTFNALLERLEKSFNSQKMFVSNVSHELRTPMAALTAELDLSFIERTEFRNNIRWLSAMHCRILTGL